MGWTVTIYTTSTMADKAKENTGIWQNVISCDSYKNSAASSSELRPMNDPLSSSVGWLTTVEILNARPREAIQNMKLYIFYISNALK